MAVIIPPPCDRFYNNLLCMKQPIVDAIAQCKKSPSELISVELVELAFLLAGAMSHQELLDAFIERTHIYWNIIATSKDVAAVLEPVLSGFKEMGEDRVQEILRVVKDKEVDTKIQERLLTLGKSLVKIALREVHAAQQKCPSSLPSVKNVHATAKLYDLDLDAKK